MDVLLWFEDEERMREDNFYGFHKNKLFKQTLKMQLKWPNKMPGRIFVL